ncbi:MAG: nucleotidyltransferase substrate binding protein [Elusimicrobia bacterium]|nr:nucleotidyltransferase substrate binding protein [Elusimicrobiota bacterium]
MSNSKSSDLRAMLGRAMKKLASALAEPPNEYVRDSAIQRFEFTFELAWKTLKACLEEQGISAYSPRDCFKEALRAGLIEDDPLWLETIKLRNLTAHTYNEATAEDIYRALPGVIRLYEKLLAKLG